MSRNYAVNDEVHHVTQGPQGREPVRMQRIYTVIGILPIESDGRPRYRIRSKVGLIERVVTEDEIVRAALN